MEQIKHKLLRIPTGGGLTRWLNFTQPPVEELNSGLPRTNLDRSRVEDLKKGPPDFKSSALNHSATLHPSQKTAILLNTAVAKIHQASAMLSSYYAEERKKLLLFYVS